ncbi:MULTISPECIES: bifunctional alpha/beta hydrolase/OsmC family protein [Pacificibacter]|uniref:bifunctional alpha/beta hydrolase/OsmC family protein n=1 Tax=Pacificibacter TaxID=1042323 RepID=UPI001C091AE3|nr:MULTISPECIES: bifunctional alpha/beta hydrolase/OsmC family protein [Pacificibacter]MBU2935508.1 bifunctional alpha/beta hydrolase/OsmC family protein [Pacificibacter marinus]MDO6614005.1 bifunctional alpha/beta hydrolase/OsmC family protein [Pacificibacter sp. 1_MG-2023]
MPTEKLTFTGHGGHQLAARLDLPTGPHHATALFAHCFTCSKDIPAARRIAGRLAAMGIAVLRFDFTGLGHSEGEFENTNFSSNVSDLVAAAAALAERGMAPSLLIGHSLGGAAVIRASQELQGIKGVVTIGAPFDPEHVTHNFGDALHEIIKDGVASVNLGGRPFRIGKQFLDDVAKGALTPALGNLKAALLVLHGPNDRIVGIDNASQIFLAAKHPKSFVTLDDADHLISRASDAEYAADVIAAWSKRYLPAPIEAVNPAIPEGILRVTEADPNGFLQDIQSGENHLLADEPISFGGTNKGPSPYGLVSAGLGACTSMTIRMYARRKKWPLTGVSVDISHAKCHASETANAGASSAAPKSAEKIDTFERIITLTGDLDEDQRAKLLEIADKCPVHKTLERHSTVKTRLA